MCPDPAMDSATDSTQADNRNRNSDEIFLAPHDNQRLLDKLHELPKCGTGPPIPATMPLATLHEDSEMQSGSACSWPWLHAVWTWMSNSQPIEAVTHLHLFTVTNHPQKEGDILAAHSHRSNVDSHDAVDLGHKIEDNVVSESPKNMYIFPHSLMRGLHNWQGILLLFLFFSQGVTASNVALSSTLDGRPFAQPGETVVFSCTTKGSLVVEWFSDEYIATGGNGISLLSFNCLNSNVTSYDYPSTRATCVSVTTENGVTIIESVLRIIAALDRPIATVTCTDNGLGSSQSINFITLEPVVLTSTLEGTVAYPGREIIFTCVTRGSFIVEWFSDEYIGTGGDSISLLSFNCRSSNVTSDAHPSTRATCVSVTTENDVTIIESVLRIIAALERPIATVTCTNNGLGSSQSINFQMLEPVVLTSTLGEGFVPYPGSEIIFTCVTRGSLVVEWFSDEYIGTGGDSISLMSANCLNSTVTSDDYPSTRATCVSVTTENGVTIIESKLYITISAFQPTGTVSCANNGLGSRDTNTFNATVQPFDEVTYARTVVVTTPPSDVRDYGGIIVTVTLILLLVLGLTVTVILILFIQKVPNKDESSDNARDGSVRMVLTVPLNPYEVCRTCQ